MEEDDDRKNRNVWQRLITSDQNVPPTVIVSESRNTASNSRHFNDRNVSYFTQKRRIKSNKNTRVIIHKNDKVLKIYITCKIITRPTPLFSTNRFNIL